MQCYRHHDRSAKRKCYKCKQPICPECQLKINGHVFCGEDCHSLWVAKREAHKQKSANKKAKLRPDFRLAALENKMEQSSTNWSKLEAALQKVEANQGKIKTGNLLALIAIVILGGAILTAFGFRNGWFKAPRAQPQTVAPSNPALKNKFDPGYPGTLLEEVYLEPPTLELAPGELQVARGKFDLYGRAPAAKRVTLLVNGRENATLAVKNPSFVFKDVQLGSGANIIQVFSRDDKGNLAYSVAQLIDYKGAEKAAVGFTPGLDYMRGSRQVPELAITFDAGGDAGYAAGVLEVLRERKIKTTIFVTGQFIDQYPDLARQIVEDGHEVGNHTYSHPHLTTFETNRHQWTSPTVTKEFLQNELLATARRFKEVTAADMSHFWRAPYGEENPEIRRWAEEVGFYHINWGRDPHNTFDTLDWLTDSKNSHYRSAEDIRKLLLDQDQVSPGSLNGVVVLMHLSTDRGKDFPQKVIAPEIDALSAKGYKLVKVSELFPALAGAKR